MPRRSRRVSLGSLSGTHVSKHAQYTSRARGQADAILRRLHETHPDCVQVFHLIKNMVEYSGMAWAHGESTLSSHPELESKFEKALERKNGEALIEFERVCLRK